MEKKPQIWIKLKNGDQGLFDIRDHDEFLNVFKRLDHAVSTWYQFTCLGTIHAINLADVDRVVYFPEGYAAHEAANKPKE